MEVFLVADSQHSVFEMSTGGSSTHARSPREFATPITLGEDNGTRTVPPEIRIEPPKRLPSNGDHLGPHSARSHDTMHGGGAHRTRDDDAKCNEFERPFKHHCVSVQVMRAGRCNYVPGTIKVHSKMTSYLYPAGPCYGRTSELSVNPYSAENAGTYIPREISRKTNFSTGTPRSGNDINALILFGSLLTCLSPSSHSNVDCPRSSHVWASHWCIPSRRDIRRISFCCHHTLGLYRGTFPPSR